MVLGVEWLRTLGPVLWDFSLMTMQFSSRGLTTVLTGINSTGWSLEGSHFLKSSPSANKGFLLKLLDDTSELASSIPPGAIQTLLQDFRAVFDEPSGLPPVRGHDHQISLRSSQPINVRSFRYPYF